jgi:hypothetical protein
VLDVGISKQCFTREASQQILDFLRDPQSWGRKMGFE